MSRHDGRDQLRGHDRLIIDGSNQRVRDGTSEPPAETSLSGSLRALIPGAVEIHVVFDTDAPPGSGTVRRAGGVTIHHAHAGGGDDAIVRLASAAPPRTLVVTDDGELRSRLLLLGASVERNEWLQGLRQRGRPVGPSVGRPLGARAMATGTPDDAKDAGGNDRSRWRPGRGATVKRGNPRRQAKRR